MPMERGLWAQVALPRLDLATQTERMYTPPHNRNDDRAELLAFMRAHAFATLVTAAGGLMATHIPVAIVERASATFITGHLAKANPQWRELPLSEALVLFQGPHAYISPTHYLPEQVSVPTWNYIAVHAYGLPRLIEEREAVIEVLSDAIAANEAVYQQTFDGSSPEWVDAKLKGIVAFELEVTRLEGRWKLSQNWSETVRERIIQTLEAGDSAATELAAYTRATLSAEATP